MGSAGGRPRSNALRSGTHEVLRLTADGCVTVDRVGIPELLRSHDIHARDLVSLALQESNRRSRRAPPLILPRGTCVVIALGHIKAIIQADSVEVFDPQLRSVRTWLDTLAHSLGGDFFERRAAAQGFINMTFELAVLEEALRDVCETCQRRVCLYWPLVDALLDSNDDLEAAESGLHRVVILKDSLSSFELEASDLMSLLTGLLKNDEDMIGLLLTARQEAHRQGHQLDISLHDDVELMLENYHRQLALCLHDIVSMQRQVQAKQEFLAISLDVHRNRLHRLNVHLNIGAVSLATCTCVAGYFGMNVQIPATIEALPAAFWSITFGSIGLAMIVYQGCMSYAGGYAMRRRARARLEEINVLQSILRDMDRIDLALKSVADSQELNKEGFREALQEATPGRSVSELEVDVLFRSLDKSGDGLLQPSEFHSLGVPFDDQQPARRE